MPTPENPYPETLRAALTVSQFELDQLKANQPLYDSLLRTYCDIFAGHPWNEDFWTPQLAAATLDRQMRFPGDVVLAHEGTQVVGFFWGSEGETDELVPFVVETYLGEELPDRTPGISATILEKIGDRRVDKFYWGCEMGLVPERRGGLTAAKMWKTAIRNQLKNRTAQEMFGMTSTDSVLYQMVASRGAELLYDMKDLNNTDTRVFMRCDLNALI